MDEQPEVVGEVEVVELEPEELAEVGGGVHILNDGAAIPDPHILNDGAAIPDPHVVNN
jgi:hypothetical protein